MNYCYLQVAITNIYDMMFLKTKNVSETAHKVCNLATHLIVFYNQAYQ